MKKTIILLLLITQIVFVNAQSLLVTGSSSVLTLDPCLTTSASLLVKNVSADSVSVICAKNVISQPSAASNYFCWGGNCYSSTTLISPDKHTLGPGEQTMPADFSGYFDAFCDIGVGIVEYCFYLVSDSSDMTCFTITYNGTPSEIKEDNNYLSIYPNPAKNYITLSHATNYNNFRIIDVLGNQVKDIQLDQLQDHNIYVGDLSKGIYFGNLIDNERVIATKKIIIK